MVRLKREEQFEPISTGISQEVQELQRIADEILREQVPPQRIDEVIQRLSVLKDEWADLEIQQVDLGSDEDESEE